MLLEDNKLFINTEDTANIMEWEQLVIGGFFLIAYLAFKIHSGVVVLEERVDGSKHPFPNPQILKVYLNLHMWQKLNSLINFVFNLGQA